MKWNVTDVLTKGGRAISDSFTYTPESVAYAGAEYPILSRTPVYLSVSHSGKGRARLAGEMSLTLQLVCDRCLKQVPYDFSLKFSNQVLAPELGAAVSEEEEDTCIIGVSVDVDDLVYNEILLNWPMKILCRPDCKGICSVCGQDLNEGTCGCDTFVPDPRMAVIKDIFNADKEV